MSNICWIVEIINYIYKKTIILRKIVKISLTFWYFFRNTSTSLVVGNCLTLARSFCHWSSIWGGIVFVANVWSEEWGRVRKCSCVCVRLLEQSMYKIIGAHKTKLWESFHLHRPSAMYKIYHFHVYDKAAC